MIPVELVEGVTGAVKVFPPTSWPHHCNVIPELAVADNAFDTSSTK